MASALRGSKRKGGGGGERSESRAAADPCPVCLEALTEDQFRFPCGHGVCGGCEQRLASHNFLSCPTCRTPRQGVSQGEVERANTARALLDTQHDELVVFAGGRQFQVLFFPDESEGQHPFGPLMGSGSLTSLHEATHPRNERPRQHGAADAATQEAALAAAEAALVADEASRGPLGPDNPHGAGTQLTLRGPLRDLVESLMRPTSMPEFLAQRERVRERPLATRSPNAVRRRGVTRAR